MCQIAGLAVCSWADQVGGLAEPGQLTAARLRWGTLFRLPPAGWLGQPASLAGAVLEVARRTPARTENCRSNQTKRYFKLRTFAVAAGAGEQIDGWFGGDRMSGPNEELHKGLGLPTVSGFKDLVDPEHIVGVLDLECGYYMCCIGDLITCFAPRRSNDEIMTLRSRLFRYSQSEIVEGKFFAAAANQLRTDVDWYLPHTCLKMMERCRDTAPPHRSAPYSAASSAGPPAPAVEEPEIVFKTRSELKSTRRFSAPPGTGESLPLEPPLPTAAPLSEALTIEPSPQAESRATGLLASDRAPKRLLRRRAPQSASDAEGEPEVARKKRKLCPVCDMPFSNVNRHLLSEHADVAAQHVAKRGRPRGVQRS